LIVLHGQASTLIRDLAQQFKVSAVYVNRDYEPAAVARDAKRCSMHCSRMRTLRFMQFKDQVIFEQDEVLSQAGKPYGVFTPYKNAHLKQLNDFYLKPYPVDRYWHHLAKPKLNDQKFYLPNVGFPSLESMGFQRTNLAALNCPRACRAENVCLRILLRACHSTKRRETFPPSKALRIYRCICVLARCPFAILPEPLGRWAALGPKPG
jgi:hypothetical protein